MKLRTPITGPDLERVRDAMYRQDLDALSELAGCGCCCEDHYHLSCPAQTVGNCRGQRRYPVNPLLPAKRGPHE